jgi:hypothetical protein
MTNQTQTNQTRPGSEEKSVIKEKTEQAKQKASELANEAQHQAENLSEQAKVEAKSSLESQKEMAAKELHGVANALRQTGSNLRQQDQTMFAQYSNRAADGVERISTYLEEHELEDFVHEAEDFARRQPELFIGGAFTLGLLAARFLKSSAPTYYEDDYSHSSVPSPTRPLSPTTSPDNPYRYDTASEMERTGRPRA